MYWRLLQDVGGGFVGGRGGDGGGGRGGICQCRQCRWQCKIFASGVNFSIFTHFFVFLSLKLLKLGEIDGVKFLA